MPIIKRNQHTEVRLFQVEDLEAAARARLDAARAEAEKILEDARADAQTIVLAGEDEKRRLASEGYAKGHKTGLAEGKEEGHAAALAEARARFQPEVEKLARAVASLERALDDAVRHATQGAEAGVIRLALAVAKAVIQREVSLDGSIIHDSVTRAVGLAARRTGVEIRIHKADAAALDHFMPDLLRKFEGLSVAKIVADASVDRGGCRVVTPEGTVDAELKTQIAEIERALLGEGA